MTLFPGGEDTAVPLLNEAVKPVGEKDIEFFGFHIDGKVNVTLGGGDGKRPLDGIFHKVSQDHTEIHVGDGERGRKIGFTVKGYLLFGSDIAVISQDRIGGEVRAVTEPGSVGSGQLLVVISQVLKKPLVFFLFCQGCDGPDRMTEIMAQPAGLGDIGLETGVLAGLHFQHLVFLFHLGPFCNGMGGFEKKGLEQKEKDQQGAFDKERNLENPADMHGGVFFRYHVNVANGDDCREKPGRPPDSAFMEMVDDPGETPGKEKKKKGHSQEDTEPLDGETKAGGSQVVIIGL